MLRSILFFVLLPGLANAQSFVPNEYVVQIEREIQASDIHFDVAEDCQIRWTEIASDMGYYVVNAPCLDRTTLVSHPQIVSASPNGINTLRGNDPNDTEYGQQATLDIIRMSDAWEYSTGGTTPDGTEITVAILDDFFSPNHPDLVDNLYINEAEIPNDGLDNDNNGYIDDYKGYNFKTQNDQHLEGGNWHGASVAGILGAKGNNNLGVTGVNWDLKMILLSPVRKTTDAQIIGQLLYAYKLRKVYNESNGAEGAFVVATNLSFGTSNVKEEDFMELCDIIDSLGQVGILSIGAGPNADINIDINGDKPTDCSSDYLIAVTNTNFNDALVSSGASYGLENMDIAAPGDDSYTTRRADDYGAFSGASASAPHVAGVVALLYSAGCPDFYTLTKENPAAAASLIKEIILDSGDPSLALEGLILSGKRLNALTAVEMLRERTCGVEGDKSQINYAGRSDDGGNVSIDITTIDNRDYILEVYDVLGRLIMEKSIPKSVNPTQQVNIPVGTWPSAVYSAILRSGDDCVDAQPFLVAH